MERIVIKSNSVIVENGKILTINGNLPGSCVAEGESLEESCIKAAKQKNIDIEIINPLNPRIQWGVDDKGEKTAVVDINYLAKKNGN